MPPSVRFANQPPQRILIVRPSALGDVCRTVPALVSLRSAFPDAEIDWIVQSEFIDAVAAHPAASEIIAFPRSALGDWWKSPGPARTASQWLRSLRERRYDLVFDLQGLGRSGLMCWATRAPRRIGFRNAREMAWMGYNVRHDPPPPNTHTVDRMLALLEAEGIEIIRDMRLYAREEDTQWWQSKQPERYAVLAPTARWQSKRWPIERWRELVSPLIARGFEKIIIIGAPGETEQVQPLLDAGSALGNSPLIDMVGKCTIGQMMAILASAGLVIANDSAPLHMAVGLDVPCLGLFGPTDPAIVGPYRKPHAAMRAFTPRPGDIINYRDPKLEDHLMRVISTASVIQAIDRVLHETSKRPNVQTSKESAGNSTRKPGHSAEAANAAPKRRPGSEPQHPPAISTNLYLASASPRRRALLAQMGISATVIPPDIDDGRLAPGSATPEQRVTGLAYLKARRVADQLQDQNVAQGIVLGADTVCAHEGRVLGQPRDADDARQMLRAMRSATHRTITGVCLIHLEDDRRFLFHDVAHVRIGELSDDEIDRYIESGDWRGKAGGYNLIERIEAGWPIECEGDPHTVMGLPTSKLRSILARELAQRIETTV